MRDILFHLHSQRRSSSICNGCDLIIESAATYFVQDESQAVFIYNGDTAIAPSNFVFHGWTLGCY
jgi:hypothetical protein